MSDTLLKLYHSLPAPARSVVASVRGYQLRAWRYGKETDRLVQEALERESWTSEQWKRWHADQLVPGLDRAATQVPFYRSYWEKQRSMGNKASWADLENWPILEKESLRQNPRAFTADDADVRKAFRERTSGTTCKPLDLWWSRETVRLVYALFEARVRLWNGVSRHNRWAILCGQLVVPVLRRKPPFWVWNSALNQLYMSAYHLAPDLIPAYLDALRSYRVEYLFGCTSGLHALAQGILKSGRTDIQMKVALTNAEPLYPYQREAISEAFQCPVRETYGNAEGVSAAAECGSGKLHLWPELGLVEVMDGNEPVPVGTSGDLVFTGISNPTMPLIRYRIGDRGRLGCSTGCSCGRSLPVLESLDGRNIDVLVTADGRQLGHLDPIFKSDVPILEAQIIQETLARVRVRYVPDAGWNSYAGATMIARLRERMGPVDVILEAVPEVPRERGGKFRAVICRVPLAERQQLAGGIHTVESK